MERSVYLALGAREGDARVQMKAGVAWLGASGLRLSLASSLWETEPVGIPPGPPVLNAAISVATDLEPPEILAACHGAEAAAGRRRTDPEWRSLDIDILLVGDLILNEPDLTIPHPRFHRRRFNLEPMNEIAPSATHPLLKLSIEELLRACPDASWARRIEPPTWVGAARETEAPLRAFVESREAVR
jgi:2-amino-4-hydroxy-6-hydroxymethyldihydropteridine diphosphokinase